jgi:hypothetical protein
MTTRFGTLLIDTADALAQARTGDAAWASINAVAQRIGANAVNAAAFLRSEQQIAWARSSMTSAWLADYAGQGFHRTDPLLHAAMAGRPPHLYDVARRERSGAGQGRHGDLHHGMMAHDYNYMVARSWFDGNAGTCIVLSCRDDPTDLFGPGTGKAFSAISAMMAQSLAAPGKATSDGRAFGVTWRPLAAGERDVLSYKAIGLSAGGIAQKLGLDEAEVARRMRSASCKMQAETADQTLALALTRGLLSI